MKSVNIICITTNDLSAVTGLDFWKLCDMSYYNYCMVWNSEYAEAKKFNLNIPKFEVWMLNHLVSQLSD